MKNYRLAVPIIAKYRENQSAEGFISELKRIGADCVWLCASPDEIYGTAKRLALEKGVAVPESDGYDAEIIKYYAEYFREFSKPYREAGFRILFWTCPTIGHGGTLTGESPHGYLPLVNRKGEAEIGCFCPLDERLKRDIAEAAATIALCGVEAIMFDDDFRLNIHSLTKIGCFCDAHIARFNRENGLNMTREELVRAALAPEANEIRKRWFKLSGESLYEFAEYVEKRVHEVNPKVRLGIATAMSLYNSEGIDVPEMMRRFAGKRTKPILRLIGAPYWAGESATQIAYIVEYNKLQQQWLRNEGIELFSEGDTYPHCAYFSSAAHMNAYKAGVLASGSKQILNYVFQYRGAPDYEHAYTDSCEENAFYLNAVAGMFGDGEYGGYRINYKLGVLDRFKFAEDPYKQEGWFDKPHILEYLTRMAVPIGCSGPFFLTADSVPFVSDGDIEEMKTAGAVLDIGAALALRERGVDVGIESADPAEFNGHETYAPHPINHPYEKASVGIGMLGFGTGGGYACVLNKGAEVMSALDDGTPTSYLYRNRDGAGFFVFTFPLKGSVPHTQLFYTYARQAQLANAAAFISQRPLDAVLYGRANVHIIVKRLKTGDTAVLLGNMSGDTLRSPMLSLAGDIKIGALEYVLPGAKRLRKAIPEVMLAEGRKLLTLKTDIPPLSYCAVRLYK